MKIKNVSSRTFIISGGTPLLPNSIVNVDDALGGELIEGYTNEIIKVVEEDSIRTIEQQEDVVIKETIEEVIKTSKKKTKKK